MRKARRAGLILVGAMFISSCSWSPTDKNLFASYSALSAIDGYQTSMASDLKLTEINPLLATAEGTPDMRKVAIIKTVGVVFIAILLNQLDEGDGRAL